MAPAEVIDLYTEFRRMSQLHMAVDEEIEMGWFWSRQEGFYECWPWRVCKLLSSMPSTRN